MESRALLQEIEFIGDSMILRYLNNIWEVKSPLDRQGNGRIGLSVEGLTLIKVLRKLLRLQKQNLVPSKKQIIVMLGTEDMLSKKSVHVKTLCRQLRSIIMVLKRSRPTAGVKQVVLFTIPPILKHHNKPEHKTLMRYNHYIRKLENEADNVRVVDVYRLFVDPVTSVPDHTLYETHMGSDGIHWNKKGITKLHAHLKQEHIL